MSRSTRGLESVAIQLGQAEVRDGVVDEHRQGAELIVGDKAIVVAVTRPEKSLDAEMVQDATTFGQRWERNSKPRPKHGRCIRHE